MKILFRFKKLIFSVLIFLIPFFAIGQIFAPASDFSEETNYRVFEDTDSIFVFCTIEGSDIGELIARTNLEGSKTYNWEFYNSETGEFDFYFSESSDENESVISELINGCYRVSITLGDTIEVYRAWVMNNWFVANSDISESNCDFFKLMGSFSTGQLKYYDLADNSEIEIYKDIKVEWKEGNSIVSRVNNPQIFDPPTSDTDYKFIVFDRFGCSAEAEITYQSIVTKAIFEIEAKFDTGDQQGEAPLEVTFSNTSENGTTGEYEWFFFRDLNEIKKESESSTEPIDSFIVTAFDDDLIYTYEETGTYMVKLVSKKISEFHTCTDTFYLEDFIVTDSSYFEIPNVFTPNNDGTNDNFVVKFWSMDDVKITIVNRWGKKVHYWEKTDVRGFEGTWVESIWDGKINGRYASSGVYYYVAEGMGRDDTKRWSHGFFHLFRGKD